MLRPTVGRYNLGLDIGHSMLKLVQAATGPYLSCCDLVCEHCDSLDSLDHMFIPSTRPAFLGFL
jgi:hypothetical protein